MDKICYDAGIDKCIKIIKRHVDNPKTKKYIITLLEAEKYYK